MEFVGCSNKITFESQSFSVPYTRYCADGEMAHCRAGRMASRGGSSGTTHKLPLLRISPSPPACLWKSQTNKPHLVQYRASQTRPILGFRWPLSEAARLV
uniref:Uncharacterized protein n=1 Tax=Kalanchoe fedtschenkoi TaxID=63787 RepID=A0A7N0RJB0_KALFE